MPETATAKPASAAHELPTGAIFDPVPTALDTEIPSERRIMALLNGEGLTVESVESKVGPSVILYAVKLAEGADPRKVERFIPALSLALGKTARYAGIMGDRVGIEVARKTRRTVPLSRFATGDARGDLSFPIGESVSGLLDGDLASMPHLLVAGTTGSGKSTFVLSMLASLLMQHTPDQLKLVMVDPKQVELSAFADLPHLMRPIATDSNDAIAALRDVVAVMGVRYSTFKDAGVQNLSDYNAQNAPMGRIVVVVDELADLMIQAGKVIEPLIVRLAQLGRAAGVHLVLATQRPDRKTFTPLIVSNIPARVVFAVQSHHDSIVALGRTGAELLTGKGDGLLLTVGMREPERFQSPFIKPVELQRLVTWWTGKYPVAPEPVLEDPADTVEPDPAAAALRKQLDDGYVPPWKKQRPSLVATGALTPDEVLADAGFTPAVVDALSEVLADRIAALTVAKIHDQLGGTRP